MGPAIGLSSQWDWVNRELELLQAIWLATALKGEGESEETHESSHTPHVRHSMQPARI